MSEIGFQKTLVEQISPLVPLNFTNAICYGQTGTGKTTGFILPNIEKRIKENHGLLIYDFKGNLHSSVKYLAQKHNKLNDVMEIGKLWGSNINILNNVTITALSKIHKLIQGEHHDSYWGSASFSLLTDMYFLLKYLFELNEIIQTAYDTKKGKSNLTIDQFLSFIKSLKINEVSIQSLFACLKDSQTLSSFLTSIKKRADNFLTSILNDNEELFSDRAYVVYNNFRQRMKNLDAYSSLTNHNDESGRYAVISTLSTTLTSIANLDFLNKNGIDITEALNNSKIVIINVANLNDNVIAALNISIYENLTRRVSYDDNTAHISIFIDEAQKVLNQEYTPDVDICRENKFEYIFATQDARLLESALGSRKMDEMKRNIASIYSFHTNDETLIQTTDLKAFEYIHFSTNRRYKADPLFIKENDLNKIEIQYQKDLKIYDPITLRKKKNTLLVHNPYLYLEKRLYIKDIKTNKLSIADYIVKEDIAAVKSNIKKEATYSFYDDDTQADDIKTINKKQNVLYEKVNKIEMKLNRFLEAKKDLLSEDEFLEYISADIDE